MKRSGRQRELERTEGPKGRQEDKEVGSGTKEKLRNEGVKRLW